MSPAEAEVKEEQEEEKEKEKGDKALFAEQVQEEEKRDEAAPVAKEEAAPRRQSPGPCVVHSLDACRGRSLGRYGRLAGSFAAASWTGKASSFFFS